jgi:hypothetical protein
MERYSLSSWRAQSRELEVALSTGRERGSFQLGLLREEELQFASLALLRSWNVKVEDRRDASACLAIV